MVKRVFQGVVLTFVGMVFLATNVYASPMAGDTVTMNLGTYQSGVGGEFLLQSSTPGNDYAFVTFCLEKNEYFTPGNTYIIESVGDYAQNGGKGRDAASPAGMDYISNTTKWLMNEYIFNYDSLRNGRNETDFAGLMQDTVWFLENESSSLADDYLLEFAKAEMGDDFSGLFDSGYLDNVQVVNIQDEFGIYKQSQLFAKPVPEPATMLLFGVGLVGVAAVSRKRLLR